MSFTDFEDDGDDDRAEAAGQNGANSATDDGSGQPGYTVEGYPDWRVGVQGPSGGLLGVIKVSNRTPGSGATPSSADPYPLPPAYSYDANGQLQLKPAFAKTHPGPFDFGGMAKMVDWSGVAKDIADTAGKVGASFLLDLPPMIDLAQTGIETWKAQDEANKRSSKAAPGSVDRATNGTP